MTTYTHVFCVCCKQRITKITQPDRARRAREAVQSYLAGVPASELAAQYRVTRSTVNRWVKEHARTGH